MSLAKPALHFPPDSVVQRLIAQQLEETFGGRCNALINCRRASLLGRKFAGRKHVGDGDAGDDPVAVLVGRRRLAGLEVLA